MPNYHYKLLKIRLLFITCWRAEPVDLREAMLTGALLYFAASATWNTGNMATSAYRSLFVTSFDVPRHSVTGVVAGRLIARIFNLRWSNSNQR